MENTAMAFDAFLKFSDKELKGEATHAKHIGEIEIYSFSFGASNPSNIGPGQGGSSSGRASLSSFNLMKRTETSSPLLFQKCCAGEHIKEATVTLNKAGGTGKEAEPFLTYKFTGVFIESIQWSGSGGGDDTPTESLSLAYEKVSITYQKQGPTGGVGEPKIGTWDITKNAP